MSNLPFIISAVTATFGYVVYLAITSSDNIRYYFSPSLDNNTLHVLFQRLTGICIFGFIPVLFITGFGEYSLADFGIGFNISGESVLWTILFVAIIFPVNYFNSRKPSNLDVYPQIRKTVWSRELITVSALSWIIYLLAYEMLFRGFLLFSSLEIMGYWPAIALNTGIYSIVHYPKGNKEAFGAVPLGILLCVLTIKTGNIWIAFFTHVALALSNEWFSLYFRKYQQKNGGQ